MLGGTGRGAQIGEFAAGKTGTTENYGDAWFVGFNEQLTVAVWVGYPDRLRYMETEYRGEPVAGGTFPTDIWHDFMRSWIGIREQRDAASGKDDDEESTTTTAPGGVTPQEPDATGPAPDADSETPEARTPEQPRTRDPAPRRDPAPTPPPHTAGAGHTDARAALRRPAGRRRLARLTAPPFRPRAGASGAWRAAWGSTRSDWRRRRSATAARSRA